MREKLLTAESICKDYIGTKSIISVIDHVSLELYKGDFTVIMGPSGAGKSTLLYALSGMDDISGGSVKFFHGSEVSALENMSEAAMSRLRSESFGFVFQQTHLVSSLTIEENILVAGYNSGKYSSADVRHRTRQQLERMGIYEIREHFPAQTSGGEAQRAAIARALINEPQLIFADEPTGALNRANTEAILNIFSELHRDGQSILMVTHDMKAALRGNRILYLEDGKIKDELTMPFYRAEDIKLREGELNRWLREMQW